MAWLRHSPRHIHHTVMNHVTAQLAGLDWMDPANTPFGAPVTKFIESPVMVGDSLSKEIAPGVVSCTLGDDPMSDSQELGGPLTAQETAIFFDVFEDAQAVSIALATDIRDILMGRIGGKRWLPLVDQSTGAVVPGWNIELDDIERVSPDQRFGMSWQVVKVTARTFFAEEAY